MPSIVANARGRPGNSGPFSWQSVFVLRHIREVAESTGRATVSSALAVYLALTETATDKKSSTVQVAVGELARRAGLGIRTTGKALSLLEDAGFVSVSVNFLGGGSLRTSNSYTLCSHDAALCRFCRALGKPLKQPELQVIGEETEETGEEAAPLSPSTLSPEWITRAEREFPRRADIRRIARKFVAHYSDQPRMLTYDRFLEWVRTERSPDERRPSAIGSAEPAGWREFLRAQFPPDRFPSRDRLEEKPWEEICAYDRKSICDEMRRASA